jgi:four helix bundle protein
MENDWKGLESLEVWKLAMQLGEIVYKIVQRWDYFNKRGLGAQWTDSTDSVANNIAEGYGRYFYSENRNFCFYGRGSLYESKTQFLKAYSRKLVTSEEYKDLKERYETLAKRLNNYINYIEEQMEKNPKRGKPK